MATMVTISMIQMNSNCVENYPAPETNNYGMALPSSGANHEMIDH